MSQASVQSRTQLYKPDIDMKTTTFTGFCHNSVSYFNKVEQGEPVRILRHGKPIADIVPARASGKAPSWESNRQMDDNRCSTSLGLDYTGCFPSTGFATLHHVAIHVGFHVKQSFQAALSREKAVQEHLLYL